MIEEFKEILYNQSEAEFLPFMKRLKAKDKKEIAVFLGEIGKDDAERRRQEVYYLSCLQCCTVGQVRKIYDYDLGYLLKYSDFADEVFAYYTPNWLSSYLNASATDRFCYSYMQYKSLLLFTEKEYIEPGEVLIAKSIGDYLIRYDYTDNSSEIDKSLLDFRSATFTEHIWYAFRYTTSMTGTYYESKDCSLTSTWYSLFNSLLEAKKIDYSKLIVSALETVQYDFKKDVVGWFADLLEALPKHKKELLAVQSNLFMTLRVDNSKMVGAVLSIVQEIITDGKFDKSGFSYVLGELLSSKVKKTIKLTLDVVTQALQSDSNQIYVSELAQGFIQTDKTIQLRIATLIKTYGNVNDEHLRANLEQYASFMLSDVKTLLVDYMENESVLVIEEVHTDDYEVYTEENKIKWAETKDDVIFMLASIFDSFGVLSIEKVVDVTLRFKEADTDVEKEQQYNNFKKACQTIELKPFYMSFHPVTKEYKETHFWGSLGVYTQLNALYFIDYTLCIVNKQEIKGVLTLFKSYYQSALDFMTKKEEDAKASNRYFAYQKQLVSLDKWLMLEYPIFRPYHKWCLFAKEVVQQKSSLPLLAMPTHEPIWIDPKVLVDRLYLYQVNKARPNETDLLLALCRCHPSGVSDLLAMAKKELNESYFKLIKTFYGEQQSNSLEVLNNSTINAVIDSYVFSMTQEKVTGKDYVQRHALEVFIPSSPWKGQDISFSEIDVQITKWIGMADIRTYIGMFGGYIELPFAQIVKDMFDSSYVSHADIRDFLLEAIKSLHETKVTIHSSTALFLACSWLCSENSIRDYGVEIWIECIGYDMIDNKEFGQYLGMLVNKEWGAVKRLNTILSDKLLNISTLHNKAIQEFMEVMILQLQGNVTALKNTLEIYSEVVSLNTSAVPDEVQDKLEELSSVASLKKIIKQLQTQ